MNGRSRSSLMYFNAKRSNAFFLTLGRNVGSVSSMAGLAMFGLVGLEGAPGRGAHGQGSRCFLPPDGPVVNQLSLSAVSSVLLSGVFRCRRHEDEEQREETPRRLEVEREHWADEFLDGLAGLVVGHLLAVVERLEPTQRRQVVHTAQVLDGASIHVEVWFECRGLQREHLHRAL